MRRSHLGSTILFPYPTHRFSIELLENFFNTNAETNSLAQSLSVSRSVCKLRHLVGCAPVCYGVPVYLKQK